MKETKMKKTIYLRIFSVFLATYLLLNLGFSSYLIFLERGTIFKELQEEASWLNNQIKEVIVENLDQDGNISDMGAFKRGLVETTTYSPLSYYGGFAIFTGDYELIYNTNDYWRCSYSQAREVEEFRPSAGLLNPKDWFSKEEVEEMEGYLYASPKVEKIGDLSGYSLGIHGFWLDDQMIIPKKIYITPMYAMSFDDKGDVVSSSGTAREEMVFTSNYEDSRDLPYFDFANIIGVDRELDPSKQEELSRLVSDESKLKETLEEYFEIDGYREERIRGLTYRYYIPRPYDSMITSDEDPVPKSKFWTVIAKDINLWQRIFPSLGFLWASSFLVFALGAYILARQSFKLYLGQLKLEGERREMTDALAHDLKTPLSIISGYAENLQEGIHTEKREDYARHIRENVSRMDGIIEKIFEMSKLESVPLEINLEEISLGNLSTRIINRYNLICQEKSIGVSLEGDGKIRADLGLMEKVIDNLIINALENTEENGYITIKISDHIFEIFNSGGHIAEEELKEIWQPYKRLKREGNKKKGTGLGLAISRRILEIHGFSYGAKNVPNGLVFWISFN